MKDSTRYLMRQLKHQRKPIAGQRKTKRSILHAMRLVQGDFRAARASRRAQRRLPLPLQ